MLSKAATPPPGQPGGLRSTLVSLPSPLYTRQKTVRLRYGPRPSSPGVTAPNLKLGNASDISSIYPEEPSKAMKMRIKLDPLSALEPMKKKLSLPESQKIMSVLDETKTKLDLIVILPCLLKDASRYSSAPLEIKTLLNNHRRLVNELHQLEKTYFPLVQRSEQSSDYTTLPEIGKMVSARHHSQSKQSLITLPVPPIPTEKQKEQRKTIAVSTSDDSFDVELTNEQYHALSKLNRVKLELEFSIRNILRAFRGNEATFKQLYAECENSRPKECSYFIQCFNDLKSIVFEKLLISPPEELEKQNYIAQLIDQQKINEAIVEKLEEELAQSVKERDAEIKAKNDIIRRYQQEIHIMEQSAEEDIRRANMDSDKLILTNNKISDSKKQRLLQEGKSIKSLLSKMTDEDRDEELMLRKKRWKVETEIENWLRKYDTDMGEKQDEYEEIDALYQVEKKQLVELEERFKILEVEYLDIIKKMDAEKERVREMQRLAEKRLRAACIIQGTWRSYQVNKQILAKANKKKKKRNRKKK